MFMGEMVRSGFSNLLFWSRNEELQRVEVVVLNGPVLLRLPEIVESEVHDTENFENFRLWTF